MSAEDGIKKLSEYPDISFIGDITLEELQEKMLTWFLEKRKELTGTDIQLGEADDRRIMLNVGAYFIYLGYIYADDAGKMNLLKYARGDYLENLGALKGISRLNASGSTLTLRYSINSPRSSTVSIPKGSRVTAGDGVYFKTLEYAEIPIGSLYVDIEAECTSTGSNTNNYSIGDITRMETAVPFIDSVTNITRSQNGRDIETDDDLRERIYISPHGYTSAGSKGAYEYYVRQYDSSIEDVSITSPSERIVQVCVVLKDGELPDEAYIKGLSDYLSEDDIKMLTDQIVVIAPKVAEYAIDITYYINESDRNSALQIQAKVQKAIDDYVLWQMTHIGRDVVPDELIYRIKQAGAKRVEIGRGPQFKVINSGEVAHLSSQSITYGGLEDD